MRPTLAATAALVAFACSSAPQTPVTDVTPENCPAGVATTVSNTTSFAYDVYYQSARSSTVIGESSPNSTITFPHPGDGRGRVYLRLRQASGGGMPRTDGSRGIRTRTHCIGA
jgi:hypothetical protein